MSPSATPTLNAAPHATVPDTHKKASASGSIAKANSKSFLEFPPELRNMVYDLVIASHEGIHQPSLINTCHQIREEALQVFYATHIFTFDARGPSHSGYRNSAEQNISSWAERIGRRHTRHLRHLRFRVRAERGGQEVDCDVDLDVTLNATKPLIRTWALSRSNVALYGMRYVERCMGRAAFEADFYYAHGIDTSVFSAIARQLPYYVALSGQA
ncbi:hypothetical protein LTR36_006926 [Oleoguttula mirabilis]|uniref:Uncharacterized protein n=1 Tax=Oleoguttula mirabilis TaxID=1507867 RepID=A0AAV9JBT4_9PEZI|nr:hypothetical protein LTR36_006926 [Oleoguttula mirabilis]